MGLILSNFISETTQRSYHGCYENDCAFQLSESISYFSTKDCSIPGISLSSCKNNSYIALHGNGCVYRSFFNSLTKGCHILCLNVICEQRHVFRLTIFNFYGIYIWRLVGHPPKIKTYPIEKYPRGS